MKYNTIKNGLKKHNFIRIKCHNLESNINFIIILKNKNIKLTPEMLMFSFYFAHRVIMMIIYLHD